MLQLTGQENYIVDKFGEQVFDNIFGISVAICIFGFLLTAIIIRIIKPSVELLF